MTNESSIMFLSLAVLLLSINMMLLGRNRSGESSSYSSSGFSWSDISRTQIALQLIVTGIIMPVYVYWIMPWLMPLTLNFTMPGATSQFSNEISQALKTITDITMVAFPIVLGLGGLILANEVGAITTLRQKLHGKEIDN